MRQYINIIKEFTENDFDDNNDNNGDDQTILVFNILWDVDPDLEKDFPKRVATTLHEVEEAADPYADAEYRDDLMHKIGNWLESKYGFGLSNFDYKFI